MTLPAVPTVRHAHGGVEWEIPVDLLEIHRRFDLADCAGAWWMSHLQAICHRCSTAESREL